MMGQEQLHQGTLFSYNVILEDRIRNNHPLRKIKELIDFDFIYTEVKDTYGMNGNISIPPPIVLKLMLLLTIYNVRSELELMDTLPERLDWLWFLDYNLESPAPNHSILSKARKRWGEATFKSFFERIVLQCVKKGLVDGKKLFMDASLIDADASNNSVIEIEALRNSISSRYAELRERLNEKEITQETQNKGNVNSRLVSTTDSDASITTGYAGEKARLRYKTHRAVDERNEIITAVTVTTGAVNEAHHMTTLIDSHTVNTSVEPKTIIADSKYGTIDNLLECHDRGVSPHMPSLHTHSKNTGSRQGIYPEEMFTYDNATGSCVCPAGKRLNRMTFHAHRQTIEYAASKKDCIVCELRAQCTRAKNGRSIHRHIRKEELDAMIAITQSDKSQRDIKTRQHLMERSFARATRYGFDRARHRGLWKVAIQEYLVCVVQNIMTLISRTGNPSRHAGVLTREDIRNTTTGAVLRPIIALFAYLFCRIVSIFGNSRKASCMGDNIRNLIPCENYKC